MPDDHHSADIPESRRHDDETNGPGYDDLDYHGDRGADIPNYLVRSMVVTLCCCLPCGLVAIVNAAKVNSLIAAGDYEAAQQASDDAKKWSMIGFVCWLICNGVGLAYQVLRVSAHR